MEQSKNYSENNRVTYRKSMKSTNYEKKKSYTGHGIHTSESTLVKVQILLMGNSFTYTINCKCKIATTNIL
jgi:hypothetical protein